MFELKHVDNNTIQIDAKDITDGSIPFENDERDWFIVVALLSDGRQISNHYPLEFWDYFKIPVYPKVKDEFDGHTIDDVFERLKELII